MLGESHGAHYNRPMTLMDLLQSAYDGLHTHSGMVALLLAALPVVGTGLARLGKGGKTDADGKLIASLVIGAAVLLLLLDLTGLWVASKVLRKDIVTVALRADAVLLLGPPLCLVASILGMRLVFPLGQLATIRTLRDVGLLLAAGGAALWLLGQFKGWGIWFLGGISELVVLGVLGAGLVAYLVRRASSAPR